MESSRLLASPKALARLGGALYLIIIVIGLFGEAYVRSGMIVSGDAAATAQNLRASEFLWRLGFTSEFVLLLSGVALNWIVWVLLRPVDRQLVWLAVFFNLVSIAIEAMTTIRLVEALFPLRDAAYLKTFLPAQRDVLAYLAIRSHGFGFAVSLIFFAGYCLVAGYLIFKSGYFPKVLGALLALAGLCYLVNSFALLLAPSFADRINPAILVPGFIGEASLCLWLLVKGVDAERWQARAGAAAAR